MSWPKGKPRKKIETKADALPRVKVEKKPETKAEPWKPGPDMGTIAPPPPGISKCNVCNHEKDKHYGGPKGWCNTNGCHCQEFQA